MFNMLCYAVLCYAMLCYAMLCYVMLRYVTLSYLYFIFILSYLILSYLILSYLISHSFTYQSSFTAFKRMTWDQSYRQFSKAVRKPHFLRKLAKVNLWTLLGIKFEPDHLNEMKLKFFFIAHYLTYCYSLACFIVRFALFMLFFLLFLLFFFLLLLFFLQ